MNRLLVTFVVLALICRGKCTTLAYPIVDVGYATYRGVYNSTLQVNDYFGIPYAEPPVGALRWHEPVPYGLPANSSVVFNATVPGRICVQGVPAWSTNIPPVDSGSEDCLLLNIIQPANTTKHARLPVVVSIHGGGYTVGNADIAQQYVLMRHSHNAFISVSIQYRLGAYGFLGSSKYSREGGSPNLGLLDQRLALDWVQKHISAFGGDPDKVTIVGGSAGGGSVTSQMIMHGGAENPPFRAVMAQFPWWQQYLREEQLSTQFTLLLSATNCTSLSCLRIVPEDDLKAASQSTYATAYANGEYGYGHFYYGPYVDGEVIQDLPSKEFRAGHFTKVPTFVDRAIYEGIVFTNRSITTKEEETKDLETQFPYANDSFIEQVYDLYAPEGTNSTFWQRQAWFGDYTINCPTYYIASSVAAFGQPIWKSVFAAGSQTHGAIGSYLSDLRYDSTPGANATLANLIRDAYGSFLIHNDPNAQSWSAVGKPAWPDYNVNSQLFAFNYTEFGVEKDARYDRDERCEFFWNNGETIQN
ncbi:Alpha/Beta hydrolase protein [Massariosphaeria phaeospora]|uniref:Carboxylic ester hydrolase n=1 Tax=Massariosphaeria phaeospora TaxID=100035 RepID=A0A7C8M1G9_9PLEO|nr:Alpha/Beta hydrolase protein [Massariosphaeria phaeospora]